MLTNLDHLPGWRITEHKGLVQGSTVQSKHIGRDIFASLKNIVGGELKGYTELLEEARNEALRRMMQQAKDFGANAVLNIRFSTSTITPGAADLHMAPRLLSSKRVPEMELAFAFGIPIALIIIGLIAGTYNERRHYRSIERREEQFRTLPVLSGESLPEGYETADVKLVSGATVIAEDRFKALLAGLRNIFGGHMRSYESLLERGRREAILRMKESASTEGFSVIVNTRFETARIAQGVEILAYGTAARKR